MRNPETDGGRRYRDDEGRVVTPDIQGPDGSDDDDGGGGWGARLAARLDLSLGKLEEEATAQTSELRAMRREARNTPAVTKISSAFTYLSTGGIVQQGGTGVGVLIGGPEVGQQWSVLQWVVGGATLAGTPAGVAWLFEAPAPPTELSITSAADFTRTALPWGETYSPRQIYVPPNSNLWMIVTAGTAAAQYVASVTIESSTFVPRTGVTNV
jgi:hypothetical protein